tara:strand:+ start:775 stop:1761 length:987 start_codon:yes stop_codon:yes gene_type:complete
VGEGFHVKAGEPHAEIYALNQAGSRAKGGTLFVTLEPCCHHGRTPPCVQAIIRAGIQRVIVALKDPDPRMSGSGIADLQYAGITVICGVLEEEASFQNRHYIFRLKTGRPWGVLKWAMSLDGRIALPNGESKWISTDHSRKWVHRLRAESDAVIVGGGTVRQDNPLLTTRGLVSPEPLRIVFSRNLGFENNLNLWNTEIAKTFIAYGPAAKASAESLELPEGPELMPLKESEPTSLMESLAKKGCNSVLWECGSSLAALAIQQNCVQELAVIVSPKLLGGVPSKTPLSDFGFTSVNQAIVLKEWSAHKIDKDLLIKASPLVINSDFVA